MKRNYGKRIVTAFITVIVAFACLAVACIASGTTPGHREKHPESIAETQGAAELLFTQEESNGITLTAHAVASEEGAPAAQAGGESFILEATVTTASGQTVPVTELTWSAEFPYYYLSSNWGYKKSAYDYIKITPFADNPAKIEVSSLAPFGATIKIMCHYDGDRSKNATCKVDYFSKIDDIGAEWNDYDFDGDYQFNTNDFFVNYTVGSVKGKLEVKYCYFELSDEAYAFIKSTEAFSVWQERSNGDANFMQQGKYGAYSPTYGYVGINKPSTGTDWVGMSPSYFVIDNSDNYFTNQKYQQTAGPCLVEAFELCEASDIDEAIRIMVGYEYTYGDNYKVSGEAYSDYYPIVM